MPRTPAGQRSDYLFHQLPTRWMDNDQYGHMNNVIHYSLIDTVVTNWQIQQGLFDESGSEFGFSWWKADVSITQRQVTLTCPCRIAGWTY